MDRKVWPTVNVMSMLTIVLMAWCDACDVCAWGGGGDSSVPGQHTGCAEHRLPKHGAQSSNSTRDDLRAQSCRTVPAARVSLGAEAGRAWQQSAGVRHRNTHSMAQVHARACVQRLLFMGSARLARTRHSQWLDLRRHQPAQRAPAAARRDTHTHAHPQVAVVVAWTQWAEQSTAERPAHRSSAELGTWLAQRTRTKYTSLTHAHTKTHHDHAKPAM
jgi:hypothetical protein